MMYHGIIRLERERGHTPMMISEMTKAELMDAVIIETNIEIEIAKLEAMTREELIEAITIWILSGEETGFNG